MELQRKIFEKILEWKHNSNGKTALLIEGARRTGKSTIASKFGKEHYDSYVLLDFAIASKRIKDSCINNLNNIDLF
jgi:hypothetical protein